MVAITSHYSIVVIGSEFGKREQFSTYTLIDSLSSLLHTLSLFLSLSPLSLFSLIHSFFLTQNSSLLSYTLFLSSSLLHTLPLFFSLIHLLSLLS